jgi:adenine-specific DNA-methyltransferase
VELSAASGSVEQPWNGKGVPLLRPGLPNLDFWVGKRVGWGIPQLKRYKSELTHDRQPLSSWFRSTADKEEVPVAEEDREVVTAGLNREGSSHLSSLMGGKVFNYPKPVSLIAGILRQATTPSSLVLDFFAGSGTTGEAVLRLNAEDQGSRRFVLVSNTEATSQAPSKNLCRDVCARRVRAAIEASAAEDSGYAEALKSGFAYLRLAKYDPIMRAEELTPERMWTLIQLRHGCPVRAWQPQDGVDAAEAPDGGRIALMPRPTTAGVARLTSSETGAGLILYTPYPSRVRPLLSGQGVEVIDARVIEPGETAL